MANTALVLGNRIHLGSAHTLADEVLARHEAKQTTWIVTLNPEMIMRGQQDSAFQACLDEADCCLPDGAGVVWALKKQGIAQERIPGIEFAELLMARLAQRGGKVALLGALPEVVALAQKRLVDRYPGLNVVYAEDGYFNQQQESQRLAALAEASPDLVLVALGVPRQELLIRQHRALLPPGTIWVGVGGSFDVWSGTLQRAPKIFRQLGMEWVWRLASQPWRIQRSLKPLLQFARQILLKQ